MSIPNVKRYRITSPDGTQTASLMAVLPKNIDVYRLSIGRRDSVSTGKPTRKPS